MNDGAFVPLYGLNSRHLSDITLDVRKIGVGLHTINLTVTNGQDRSHTALHILKILNASKVPLVSTALSTTDSNTFFLHKQIEIGPFHHEL